MNTLIEYMDPESLLKQRLVKLFDSLLDDSELITGNPLEIRSITQKKAKALAKQLCKVYDEKFQSDKGENPNGKSALQIALTQGIAF